MSILLSDYFDGDFEKFEIGKQHILRGKLQWLKKQIIDYLEQDLLNVESNKVLRNFIINTRIEFSKEEKSSPYVSTRTYVIYKLKKAEKNIDRNDCPIKEPLKELIKELEEMTDEDFADKKRRMNIRSLPGICENESCGLCDDQRRQSCYEKVFEIIGNYIRNGMDYEELAGEYHFETNTITLYLNVINKNRFDNFIETVFAHELFHAYHMKSVEMAGGKWLNSNRYSRAVVLESLAASFDYFYTKHIMKNEPICDASRKSWDDNDVEYWPYSGAKGIVSMTEIAETADNSRLKMAQPFTLIFTDSLDRTENDAYEDIVVTLKYTDETPVDKLKKIRNKYNDNQKKFKPKTSTIDFDGYVAFLQRQGLSTKAVATRKRNLLDAEKCLPFDIDMTVMNDKIMYAALKFLSTIDNPAHSQRQNALRHYYRFKRGIKFPKLREVEYLYNNAASYKIMGARIGSSTEDVEINDFLRGYQTVEEYRIEAELEIEDGGQKVFLLGLCTYNPGYIVTFSVTKESLLLFSENKGRMPQREYEEKFNEISGEGIKDIFPRADAEKRYSDLWLLIIEMFNSQARKDGKNCEVKKEYGTFWQIKYDLDREQRETEFKKAVEECRKELEEELKERRNRKK